MVEELDTLLHREQWLAHKDEEIQDYAKRLSIQTRQFLLSVKRRGYCYIVKFGEDDLRPMWEDNINIIILKKDVIKTGGGTYDCPLCQPYDPFGQLIDTELSRRFLCKIISPQYDDGCLDEGGVWAKCPCIDPPKRRNRHKFKKGE